MASDIGKQRLGQVKKTHQCISLFLIQDTVQNSVCFPNVSEFVWIYLHFYGTQLLLQAGSCIMHHIHSLYCFMVSNFPLQYKSDCNSDIFNKKLDTLLLPHFSFFFFFPIIHDTGYIKSVFKIKLLKSLLNKILCMLWVLSWPWRMKMFCKELMPATLLSYGSLKMLNTHLRDKAVPHLMYFPKVQCAHNFCMSVNSRAVTAALVWFRASSQTHVLWNLPPSHLLQLMYRLKG